MRRGRGIRALLVAMVLAGACNPAPSPVPPASSAGASEPPVAASPSIAAYRDPSRSLDERVADLLARMTEEEEIGQLTLIEIGSASPATVHDRLLGGVLSGGDGNPTPNDPEAWYTLVDGYQQAALGTRLGIPILYGVDAIHGQSHVVGATIFPHQVGLGATHDAALVEQVGRVTAAETSATGIRWTFGPIVAVPQDVRWGRTYEGFGEDPVAVGGLATALIRGLQGADLSADDAVAATPKHFVGDGGTGWGTSDAMSASIDRGVTAVDDLTFRAVHLAPYLRRHRGRRAHRHGLVLEHRRRQGSRRPPSPDRRAEGRARVHRVRRLGLGRRGRGHAGRLRRFGGAGAHGGDRHGDGPVGRGPVPGRRPARAPGGDDHPGASRRRRPRILRVKLEMGLFERPMPATDRSVVGSAANRALAAQAVAESTVLLRTSPGTLPIPPDGRVLLAGLAADDIGTQLGGWSITWQGSTGPTTSGTTLRGALSARLGERLAWDAAGAFEAGTRAPLGVVVVAERPYAEWFGDSATLALPPDDVAVVGRVRPLVDRLVVVVYSGRPVMLDGLEAADAVAAAWLPGTEAEGLADVLLGDRPFTGTTPYTWPATPADAPRTGKGACDGAFYPVGFGLDAAGALLGPAACGR